MLYLQFVDQIHSGLYITLMTKSNMHHHLDYKQKKKLSIWIW